ncbi:MAG: 3-deoxy-manno-octulosonate cytidylyltransferase [Spirochaetes bacterium]|nr:3-deoxy-manno-octulosonate cytidylyltransferase [Spirochaetota bacterium]
MNSKITPSIVIPARLNSQRLERKMLYKIGNSTLIGLLLKNFDRDIYYNNSKINVYCLTDSYEIIEEVKKFKKIVPIMTPDTINSGTERIIYSINNCLVEGNFFINIQGDEPLVTWEYIEDFINWIFSFDDEKIDSSIFTIGKIFDSKEIYLNPNNVKAIVNKKGEALYFSRAGLPFYRSEEKFKCILHYGIYGYSKNTLINYSKMKDSELEKAEKLEQLKFIDNGGKIYLKLVEFDLVGIDTEKDIERLKNYIKF